MQDHESEQDPVEHGGQEPPRYETDAEPTLPYGSTQQPGYGANSQQTDAFWFMSHQPPGYGPGGEPAKPGQPTQPGQPGQPSYGGQPSQPSPGDQPSQPSYGGQHAPPPYPGSWQPPGAGNWPPPPGTGFGQWGTPPEPPHRRGRRLLAFALVAILGIGIGAAAAFGLTRNSQQQTPAAGSQSIPSANSQKPPLQNTNSSKLNVQAIANAVQPSVVDVTSKLQYSSETAEGTGIVLNSSGLVLTNNHVIDNSTQVTGQIDGTGRTYTATVVGTDKTEDVALLQLQGASGLKAAAIGDSSKVAIGDAVVALGNQGGQGGAPAVVGAITNLNKTITAGDQGSADSETLHGMLQTNAAIVAGDSGGPLVNSSGQVIGVDTAAASNNFGQSVPIGFAIPINHALSIARQIAAGHASSTIQIGLPAFMGVIVPPSSSSDPQSQAQGQNPGFGSGFGGQSGSSGCITSDRQVSVPATIAPASSGALIEGTLCGTPAATAGIGAGDVITAVDGTAVGSPNSLTTLMKHYRPGQTVSVKWTDTSGATHTSSLTLVAGPAK